MSEKSEVLVVLEELRGLRDRLLAEERPAVLRARELGLSWEAIAKALGKHRKTVWMKYRDE